VSISLVHLEVETVQDFPSNKPVVSVVACTFTGLVPNKPVILDLLDFRSAIYTTIACGTPSDGGRVLLETRATGTMINQQIFLNDYLGLRLTVDSKVVYSRLHCYTSWREAVWYLTAGPLRTFTRRGTDMTEVGSRAYYQS
jgi:hypothetical protein